MAEVEPSDVVKLLEIKWAGKATAAKQSRRSIRDINLAAGLLRIGRRVPLNSRADAVLARRGSKRSALVFGTRRWDHYPTAWESAVERAKLVDFHDLRDTFASWAIQRGASLQEVTDILGHHSLAMTLRYGHLAPEPLRSAVVRLDAALPVPAKISAQGSAQEGVTEGALLSK